MSWECAHCVSPRQKIYYIYSLRQLERLYNAMSDKKNLNLSCFVSFKEPELRNVLLVINCVLTRNDNNFSVEFPARSN